MEENEKNYLIAVQIDTKDLLRQFTHCSPDGKFANGTACNVSPSLRLLGEGVTQSPTDEFIQSIHLNHPINGNSEMPLLKVSCFGGNPMIELREEHSNRLLATPLLVHEGGPAIPTFNDAIMQLLMVALNPHLLKANLAKTVELSYDSSGPNHGRITQSPCLIFHGWYGSYGEIAIALDQSAPGHSLCNLLPVKQLDELWRCVTTWYAQRVIMATQKGTKQIMSGIYGIKPT